MTSLESPLHAARGVVRVSAGVDLVDVWRVSRLAAQPSGLSGVLTERELSYCCSRRRPAEHMAARFAAKEAVLKAFGTGLAKGMGWTDVEIVRDASGRPAVELHGRAARLAAERGLRVVDVSLSHTAHLAIAHAVATWADPSESVDPPTVPRYSVATNSPIRSLDDIPADRRRGGEVRVLLSPGTAGSTSGFMGMATLAPGERIAEHYHPYSEEFLCVVTGEITAELDGVAHVVRQREGLLISPKVRHRLRNHGAGEACVVFHLGPLAPRPDLGHVDTETDGGPGTVASAEKEAA
jgi:putative monooxygenase